MTIRCASTNGINREPWAAKPPESSYPGCLPTGSVYSRANGRLVRRPSSPSALHEGITEVTCGPQAEQDRKGALADDRAVEWPASGAGHRRVVRDRRGIRKRLRETWL